MSKNKKSKFWGDKELFIENWKKREEVVYNHWTKKEPQNQVQLAFRNHWLVFKELLESKSFNKGKRCLEIGCGRGSISSYFSEANYDCTLLDISPDVIESAKNIFRKNKLKAKFVVGDANKLPFPDNSFDVVVSIGLLEHFKNIKDPISEQIRVLDKGGIFLGYVVPEYKNNIQNEFNWINDLLKGYAEELFSKKGKKNISKDELYRSDFDSKFYIKEMKKLGLKDIESSGIYSLPMISHSIDFPFSLMPKSSEKALVKHFIELLNKQKKVIKKNPWLCKEGVGQAFLVYGFKK